MSGAGTSPDTGAEFLRAIDQRLRRLESGGPIRIGKHVIGVDDGGKIIATSPDGSTVLTPDPPPPADITAGILPGLFAASRADDDGVNVPAAGYHPFAADWYDTVEITSDRMVFNPDTNTVRCESTALLAVRVQQGVVSGQSGQRQFRSTLALAYDEADTPTVVRTSPNAYYDDNAELVFGDTFLIPVNAGALLTPGYWASTFSLGSLVGDAAGLLTRFEIARVLDLQ